MIKKLLILLALALPLYSCGGSVEAEDPADDPDIPIDAPDQKIDRSGYVKSVWAMSMLNATSLNSRAKVEACIDKLVQYGFNEIWLEVKPSLGHALYDSDLLPRFTTWESNYGTQTVPADYDYLGTVLDVATEKGVGVMACINALGFGDTKINKGLVYDDHKWDGKTQCRMLDNNPLKIQDIRDSANSEEDGALLEPSDPDVQKLVIGIVSELCTKYPGIKGICLDYCRYYSGDYGMSDVCLDNFRTYCGNASVGPGDIITSNGGQGKYYAQWIEFRSYTIRTLIEHIREAIKTADPNKRLSVWASADYESRYLYGQNWGSSQYMYSASSTFTSTYNTTAYGELLDIFALGAYSEHIKATDSYYSVEGYLQRYPTYMKDATTVIGSVACYNCRNRSDMSDVTYLCMANSSGILVFDLHYVENMSHWYAINDGFKRANAL